MAILPLLSSREIIRTFLAFGWQEARRKGSHIILVKDGHVATPPVPDHKKVARGTL